MHVKFLLPLICLGVTAVQADEQRQLPNVIFVLADDLGIGDLEPTSPDCRIKTPHLKEMASEGITFLDAHSSSAVCTPTRYDCSPGVTTGGPVWRGEYSAGRVIISFQQNAQLLRDCSAMPAITHR